MKICLIDSVYPEVEAAYPVDPALNYEDNLAKFMQVRFGTFDAWSRALQTLGWSTVDIVASHAGLQELWARQYNAHMKTSLWAILEAQLQHHEPDVVFLQDLSLSPGYRPKVMAGQLSCPWPGDEQVKQCDVIFTSFPHYVPRIEALGVKAIYFPLAFDPSVIPCDQIDVTSMMDDHPQYADGFFREYERIHDVVFIGGVGNPSHWKRGMETLHYVAEHIPTFKWWGYGADLLPDGPLKQKWQGQAFGADMYGILMRAKIGITRHGEVSHGFTNNLRCYEIAGSGALLMTEASPNLSDLFPSGTVVPYGSANDLCEKLEYYLSRDDERAAIAAVGQAHVLKHHTYATRMKHVSDVLTGMLSASTALTLV